MPAKIEIILDDQGNIAVNGPFDNPIFCYGLIELGKQSIIEHLHKQRDRLVQPVSMLPPSFPGTN